MSMTVSFSRCHVAGLLAALSLAACSSTRHGAAPPSPQPAGGEAGRSVTARAKADSLRYPYTRADVDFMSHMIDHHAQAIAMARWAPTHGASSSVRILAERIINGQQDEIATMQRWLRDRGQPVSQPDSAGTGMAMHGHEHGHEHLMPGMLTEAQMKELDQARGSEFNRQFLTYMIQHHRGAVSMVEDLFGSRGAAQDETVFKFASDVSVDQSTEIARMERMLAALPPGKSSR
jgi:uncharacterized protein (DUF305 family)